MADTSFDFAGGINQADDINISPSECVDGRNFIIDTDTQAYKPRDPFDLVVAGPSDIRGIIQLIKRDNTITTLIQHTSSLSTLASSVLTPVTGSPNAASKLRGKKEAYWPLDDYVLITDLEKLTPLSQWDGTTFSTQTTGLGSALYAKYCIVFNGRAFLFNITEGSNQYPHMILASKFEDPTVFDIASRSGSSGFTTGEEAFFMLTKDLKEINGVALYYDTIIISTKEGRLFRLQGFDSTNFSFVEFYPGSSTIGEESIINTGNDIMFMRQGSVIESLLSTDQFGDVKADNASRQIARSIKGHTGTLPVYDQNNDRVIFFMTDKAFTYDKTTATTGLSPWSHYTSNINFNTNAAEYINLDGTWTVVFGTPDGDIYNFNGTGTGDAGTLDINTYRDTKMILEINNINALIKGRLLYKKTEAVDMLIDFSWTDNNSATRCTVPLKAAEQSAGTTFWGGEWYWNDGNRAWNEEGVFVESLSTAGFTPAGKGLAFVVSIGANSTSRFNVNKVFMRA